MAGEPVDGLGEVGDRLERAVFAQPATYGIDSPLTSNPTLDAASQVAVSTITSARSRPYSA